MGVRKNAKFLTGPEREAFARACILMKADIVNPTAPAADQYSKWDEFAAVHRMIQNVATPAVTSANFGHGGTNAFSFLSWHRYFLYRFEARLQSYVPGVMLPYWDWTDPIGTILADDFLGPNGTALSSGKILSGYFAEDAPGTGANPTPAPAWWPPGLVGFRMHADFGTNAGALKRTIAVPVTGLPSTGTLRKCLDMANYETFQACLEGGIGLPPGFEHLLHNGLHNWFGNPSHMRQPSVSASNPIFYLHHCNIDRLWAMWQLDGHETEYPSSGGNPHHNRTDLMYPSIGGAAGYSPNFPMAHIVIPTVDLADTKRNEDMLDHRALNYTYDSMAVIGISLDRTGSMNQLTPDPMTTGAPDVTKWEAAKRGVQAFLQDCEAAYDSGAAYVVAGVKTFRSLGADDFAPVFAGTPYGLVKSTGGYSSAGFSAAISGQTPGGATPLTSSLLDAHATLVSPPFGWMPADEQRCLAMLTDGLLTSGPALSTIPDGSLANTAVFAMGFGTAADVDYGTLAAIAAKGVTLTTPQVFHGENAGTIDKFYSSALAQALGFNPVIDPVLDLFAGEHTHLDFTATSAEETFLITAQGMDFDDPNWWFHLIGPDGSVAYADGGPAHVHGGGGHSTRLPRVTARRGRARLSLFLERDSADAAAWVGTWYLVIGFKAKSLLAMMMPELGELLVPVSGGPVRGPRYSRILASPPRRLSTRITQDKPRHRLDVLSVSTNSSKEQACSVVVNIYARTRLKLSLSAEIKEGLTVQVRRETTRGDVSNVTGFSRLIAPAHDIAARVQSHQLPPAVAKKAALKGSESLQFDSAKLLAHLEMKDPRVGQIRDEELHLVSHHGGPLHAHAEKASVPGAYHVGVYVEGVYHSDAPTSDHGDGHVHGNPGGHPNEKDCVCAERFTRLLTISAGKASSKAAPQKKPSPIKHATK